MRVAAAGRWRVRAAAPSSPVQSAPQTRPSRAPRSPPPPARRGSSRCLRSADAPGPPDGGEPGGAYAVVGWLLIQVATQVFPFLEIPNWAIRLVILVIALGFWSLAIDLDNEAKKKKQAEEEEKERLRRQNSYVPGVLHNLFSFGSKK